MKIVQIFGSEKFSEDNDYMSQLGIKVNDKMLFRFLDGEPEDNNLCRNFRDCYNIVKALSEAYQAGKNGEEFVVEELETDDFI